MKYKIFFFFRKGKEFSQLLDVRAGSTTLAALKLDGSSRYVMCVDLAASSCGTPVDRVDNCIFSIAYNIWTP